MTNPNQEPHSEISEVLKGLGAIAAIGHEMAKPESKRGVHETVQIEAKDSFGEYTKQWKYTKGCVLGTELNKPGVIEVALKMKTADGADRTVGIGKTPAEYDPSKGGAHISSAGDPGEYLLVVFDAGDAVKRTYRYIDAEELEGVTVEHGSTDLRLNPNPARQRQMHVAGAIEQASAFLS